MKILQRRNGDWCMEHNGVEAPFEVICQAEDKFTVLDLDDEDGEHPVAYLEDRETAERLALQFHERNPG